MARKLFMILCLLILWVINGYSTNRYVSASGNDLNSGLSPATPYATLGKASTTAVNPGDSIIIAAGSYTQSTQVSINVGVHIKGAGNYLTGGTKITLTYNWPGGGFNIFNQCAIQLVSATVGTNGNQSIRDIYFDGNSYSSLMGILVRARSNVIIERCRFNQFGVCAVNLNGKTPSNMPGVPPSTFSTGNQVINCIFTDCADRITQTANSVSCGSISYSGQANLLFQYDTLSNVNKGLGHNGNLFAAIQGNNKTVSWLNCVLTKPLEQNDGYNFCIESWYDMGGCIFANNTIVAGGNVIDVGYGGANKGASAYSWWVHDNIVTLPALTNYAGNSGTTGSIFFQMEPTTDSTRFPGVPQNTTIGDAIVEYNYIKNGATLVQVAMNNYSLDFIDNININHNVMENCGYINNAYGGALMFAISKGVRINNVTIDNNTLVSNTGIGSSKAILILQPNVGLIENIYFRNNIAMNALGYGYLLFRGNKSCNLVFSQNNITFGNAFSNNPNFILTSFNAGSFIVGNKYRISFVGTTNWVAIGAASNTAGLVFTATGAGSGTGVAATEIPPTNFTNADNMKVDPQFVSASSPVDYHLAAGSPGIGGGLNPPATYVGAYPPGTITPTITWTPSTPYVYGNGVSAAQLNATSGGVPGTFSYNHSIGEILNAGTYSFIAVFHPTDSVTYSSVSKTVTVVVDKKPETLSYSGMTVVFNNTPQNPIVATSPDAGITVINTTLNGLGGGQTNAGSYAAVSGLTSSNYVASPINGTFTIAPKPGTITVSNLLQVYDGSGKTVSVTTSDPFATVTTYDGSGSPSVSAGNHTVITSNTNNNYNVKADTSILVISQATPTLTSWNPTTPITHPTPIGASQLNAVWSVAGITTYTPISGTIPNAGSLTITGDFVPSNSNYQSVLGTTRTITVNQGVTSIAVSDTVQFFDGTVKNITAIAGQSGTVTVNYTGAHTAVGDYPFTASFSSANWSAPDVSGTLHILSNSATIFITNYSNRVYSGLPIDVTVTSPYSYSLVYNPSGHTNVGSYQVIATINDGLHSGADTVTMTIIKADPDKLWGTPADISYGTLLSGIQLNAFSSIPGTWNYSSPSGTLLPVGSTPVTATFTPTDLANYNIVTITVNITVTQASATMAFQTTTFTYDGTPKSVQVITNPVNLTGVAIVGSPQTNAGTYPISATMSNTNYQASPISGTFTIYRSNNYTLSWAIPSQIIYPQPLTSLQLNPASTISGSFTYNYVLGTILNPGSWTLIATFHPSNTNYNTKTISVPLSVAGSPVLLWYITHGNTIYQDEPIP